MRFEKYSTLGSFRGGTCYIGGDQYKEAGFEYAVSDKVDGRLVSLGTIRCFVGFFNRSKRLYIFDPANGNKADRLSGTSISALKKLICDLYE